MLSPLGALTRGLVAGSLRRPRLRHGLLFGPTVWASDYAVLPLGGFYDPIWTYDARTLVVDLGWHAIYGLASAAAFRLLARA